MELSFFFFFLVLFISKKQRRSRQSRMVGIIQLSHKMREAQAGNYAYCDFFSRFFFWGGGGSISFVQIQGHYIRK